MDVEGSAAPNIPDAWPYPSLPRLGCTLQGSNTSIDVAAEVFLWRMVARRADIR
jgi:hypothetical protein